MENPLSVLVVEDDALAADVIARWLRRRGYTVKIARTGVTAVQMALAEPPSLVLMDLSLPGGMNGLDATRQLRAAEATRDIPILILTGHGDSQIEEDCASAGANGREEKPVDFPKLLQRIDDLVKKN